MSTHQHHRSCGVLWPATSLHCSMPSYLHAVAKVVRTSHSWQADKNWHLHSHCHLVREAEDSTVLASSLLDWEKNLCILCSPAGISSPLPRNQWKSEYTAHSLSSNTEYIKWIHWKVRRLNTWGHYNNPVMSIYFRTESFDRFSAAHLNNNIHNI